MATTRTTAAIPGGGTVTLGPRALRLGLKFRNLSAGAMTIAGAAGWTAPVAAVAVYIEMPVDPELAMQGPLTVTGTATQVYDLVEVYR